MRKVRVWGGALALALLLVVGCTKKAAPTSEGEKPVATVTKSGKPAGAQESAPVARPALADPVIWQTAAEVEAACGRHLGAARSLRDKLVATPGERTLANTLEPFNDIFRAIDAVLPQSELLAHVHPDKATREAAERCEQEANKLKSELKLDRDLYDALVAVPETDLDAAARRFRRLLLREYRRAGVDRDKEIRDELARLDAEMVSLGQTFSRTIREDKRSIEVEPSALEGLPPDFLASHVPEGATTVRLTTDYPDYFPVQSYADDEDVRRRLFVAYMSRGYPENEPVLKKLLTVRHRYATLLGYPDWASYAAEDKMVKTKEAVDAFIDRVADLARPRMETDRRELLARKQADEPAATFVAGWDRFYYLKKLQAERFGVDPLVVRAYFDVRAVTQGLLDLTEELFRLELQQVADAPAWDPRVQVYDVFEDGARIARFYLDLYPRDGKYGHAAEFTVISGIAGEQLPAAALVTNFPDPEKAAGGPALMEHSQVTTFFHEFGHLVHQLLAGRHKWVTQSGITCEWDFVEAPSQLLEEWARDASVLARFAKHHETGEPIPADLVAKMKAADELGKGMHVLRQMFYARLSYSLHAGDPTGIDLMARLKELQAAYSPYPYTEGTADYTSFGHLYSYSSMYYTYMWSLVLAKDFFTRFREKGLMDSATAAAFRREVLEPGGARDAEDMVTAFLGRPSSFAAFESWLKH